ncbi:hypothetical protein CKAN_01951100 [Cinnamomum micranthum f. kanehirae]|uniref:Uncharacterized protein n=1 Tax=Cinnamomum micranthum f. kanehirae TaxID=337451 RepID=A0A443PI09_9MAGN|nr:hypothetical protein CKAN_01951100 [Cinnamomum micranthum f. kanehirae]
MLEFSNSDALTWLDASHSVVRTSHSKQTGWRWWTPDLDLQVNKLTQETIIKSSYTICSILISYPSLEKLEDGQ